MLFDCVVSFLVVWSFLSRLVLLREDMGGWGREGGKFTFDATDSMTGICYGTQKFDQ